MKNYRTLIPLAMIAIMVVSIYSMVSGAITEQTELNSIIERADKCSNQKLYSRAEALYSEAIAIDDDIKWYCKVVDMYYKAQLYDSAIAWSEEIVSKFPTYAIGYEKALKVYMHDEDYEESYKIIDEFDGRKLESNIVEKYKQKIKNKHFLVSYYCEDVGAHCSGYINVMDKGLWGLAKTDGSKVSSFSYKKISCFANEMVAVLDEKNEWFFMDKNGEYIYNISDSIKGNISEVGIYNNGLIPICVNGKYGYYDIDFEKVFGDYDYAGAFNSGIAAVKSGTKWQLINTDGKMITKDTYSEIIVDERGVCCNSDRIFVKPKDMFILVDKNGKQVGNEMFESARLFESENPAAVMKDGLWGFVDHSGKVVVEPYYFNAKSFSSEFAPVCIDEFWGFIDLDYKEAIELKYQDCAAFSSDGNVFVKENDRWNILKLYRYNH